MRYAFFFSLFLFPFTLFAQPQPAKSVRAFPITDYIIQLNDSIKLVQVELPDDLKIAEKEPGLLRGVYTSIKTDTVQKGYGRCHMIKGNYYYFSVGNNTSGLAPRAGDLLYTRVEQSAVYNGLIPQLAAHFIRLQDVMDTPLYDRFEVFRYWTPEKEESLIDSVVKDIRFTGNYFLEQDPSMNVLIGSGDFKGQYLLQVMKECKPEPVKAFFAYILARPRLYAGRDWKIAEIFATWLAAGAPMVIRE